MKIKVTPIQTHKQFCVINVNKLAITRINVRTGATAKELKQSKLEVNLTHLHKLRAEIIVTITTAIAQSVILHATSAIKRVTLLLTAQTLTENRIRAYRLNTKIKRIVILYF